MLNGDTELIDKNLLSWTVVSVSSTKIFIDLTFEKPLSVSAGDFPDTILIQVSLSAFTDQNGLRMPPSVLKQRQIPIQFSSSEEAITYGNLSDNFSETT